MHFSPESPKLDKEKLDLELAILTGLSRKPERQTTILEEFKSHSTYLLAEIQKVMKDTNKSFTKHPAKKEAYLMKWQITQKAIQYACKGLW